MIGGARLTNESAYAWAKLAKGVIGTDSVDAQLGDGLPADLVLGLPRATIDAAAAAPVLITLAGDLREELPVLFLRLREAVMGATTLIELAAAPTALTPLATASLALRPGEAPVVARALCGDDAAPPRRWTAHPEGSAVGGDALGDGPRRAGGAPRRRGRGHRARPPVVRRVGRGGGRGRPGPGRRRCPRRPSCPALRRGNVFGALDMGLAPGLLPGRVDLESGREWFTAAWGACPRRPGSTPPPSWPPWPARAPAQAGRGAGPAVTALILLGADPLSDFPDRAVAEKALSAGHFVVAVTGHPSESVDVLRRRRAALRRGPRAPRHDDQHRGPGQPVGPEADRARVRLARLDDRGRAGRRPGPDLGVSSANDLADELQLTAPAYFGLTLAVLHSDAAHDGILVPIVAGRPAPPADVEPIDPMALPGVESVERQGAPPRSGSGRGRRLRPRPHRRAWERRPHCSPASRPRTPRRPTCAPADSYALRLVAPRRLYDAGSSVTGSPSLTPLVPAARGRGPTPTTSTGWAPRPATGSGVRSARGELVLPAEADAGVPRGAVAVDFNVPVGPGTPGNAVATLIDSRNPVTDVRLESV